MRKPINNSIRNKKRGKKDQEHLDSLNKLKEQNESKNIDNDMNISDQVYSHIIVDKSNSFEETSDEKHMEPIIPTVPDILIPSVLDTPTTTISDNSLLTYPDPNVYLLSHPEKSEWAKISSVINYTHIIITRFSYRFRENDPVKNLFDPTRMKRRFQLLEAFCFPSITSQINPNFYWVLVIDRELPSEYLDRLHQLIARFYESPSYRTRGPRQIILHKWQYTCPMSSVEWLRESNIPIDSKKYLITTRLDDDDSLCKNFTNLVYAQFVKNTVRNIFLITFEFGYYWYSSPKMQHGVFKISTRPYIALGLTLVTHLKKYPLTIYFGNHTKLVYYIKNYQDHKLLRKMFERNKETITDKNFSEKYVVVKRTEPVYIRTVHDQGLQRGQKNIYKNNKMFTGRSPMNVQNLTQINKGFHLNLKKVEKVNSKI